MKRFKYAIVGILALIGLICTLAANAPGGIDALLVSVGLSSLALSFWITGL